MWPEAAAISRGARHDQLAAAGQSVVTRREFYTGGTEKSKVGGGASWLVPGPGPAVQLAGGRRGDGGRAGGDEA